jgi:hypothetical protein
VPSTTLSPIWGMMTFVAINRLFLVSLVDSYQLLVVSYWQKLQQPYLETKNQ